MCFLEPCGLPVVQKLCRVQWRQVPSGDSFSKASDVRVTSEVQVVIMTASTDVLLSKSLQPFAAQGLHSLWAIFQRSQMEKWIEQQIKLLLLYSRVHSTHAKARGFYTPASTHIYVPSSKLQALSQFKNTFQPVKGFGRD